MEFILFWFSLFVLVFLTHIIITFCHELAHKNKLEKNKILCEIKWNISGIIKSFGASPMARCFFDENKFNKLNKKYKKEIILAGIYSDLIFTFLFVILSILSWFYIEGSFLWYYLNIVAITIILKILLNFFGKGSDGEKYKLHKLNKLHRLNLSKRKGEE